MTAQFGCPVEFTLEMLGGKWKTVLLAHMKGSPMRYRDLRQRVTSLSDKVLTERLRELERDGLIVKNTTRFDSPHYELTDTGRTLVPVLQALYDWGSTRWEGGKS